MKTENTKSHTSPIRAFGKDTLNYIPANIIPGIVGFFAIAAYTRLLNTEQYGQYILTITTISLVSSAAFSWLNQSGLRYFEEYNKKGLLVRFTSTAFISLFGSILVILFIWGGVTMLLKKAWHPDLIRITQIAGIVLAAQVIYMFVLMLLRAGAGRKTSQYALYTVINSLGTFLLAVCLIRFVGLGVEGILLAMIILLGSISLIELIQLVGKNLIRTSCYSIDLLKRFASYGIPMIGVSMGALFVSVSDRYMIQYIMGTKAVGIYSAGYDLAQKAIQGMSTILILAAFPIIFRTFAQKGVKETGIVIGRLMAIYLTAIVPAVFGVVIVSKDMVGVCLGESFRHSHIIMPWVATGVFCDGLGLYCSASYKLKEKTNLLFYVWAIAATVNIILNIICIPRFGMVGAAYATLVAFLVYLSITWIFGVKLLPYLFPWKTLWKTVLAASTMAIIVNAGFSYATIGIIPLITKIAVGIFLYLIFLAILREKIFLDALRFGRRHFRSILKVFGVKNARRSG